MDGLNLYSRGPGHGCLNERGSLEALEEIDVRTVMREALDGPATVACEVA